MAVGTGGFAHTISPLLPSISLLCFHQMVAICANTCNVMLSGVSQNQKEEKDEKLAQFVICSVLVFHCILSPAAVLLFTGNKYVRRAVCCTSRRSSGSCKWSERNHRSPPVAAILGREKENARDFRAHLGMTDSQPWKLPERPARSSFFFPFLRFPR